MSKKSALNIAKGVEDAPFINPKWKGAKRRGLNISELAQKVIEGDNAALSRAITLIESASEKDESASRELLNAIIPAKKEAFVIGVSGVPGVGKSTFLESYCSFLLQRDSETTLAILAVDPSSELSKGSILGDKTRMESIGKSDRVFIRPSASGGRLGGVARSTYEAVALCEAAGFDFIFVETVGVGQSETVVSKLTDCFLFLAMPGTGDELQGIKKGIMEMADIIALNKCDGPREKQSNHSALELRNALQLVTRHRDSWQTPVVQISALESKGMEAVWTELDKYYRHSMLNGWFSHNRQQQREYWFKENVGALLFTSLTKNHDWKKQQQDLLEKVAQGLLSPFEASRRLVEKLMA
jgi:LAO/AO transport system kinase